MRRIAHGPNELVNGRPLGLAVAIGHVSVPVERTVRFGGRVQERWHDTVGAKCRQPQKTMEAAYR